MVRQLIRGFVAAVILISLWSPIAAHASSSKSLTPSDMASAYEAQLLELAKRYTPEQAETWKAELEKREELRNKVREWKKSRAYQERHEAMKEELRKKIESGQMTEDEAKQFMKEKHKKFTEKHKQWKEEGKQLREQLDKAIKQEDQQAIKDGLNAMLERLTKGNEMLAKRLEQVESSS